MKAEAIGKIIDSLRDGEQVVASSDTGPWKLGTCYLIRTVTMIDLGRLSYIGDKELVLDDASWIADTARWNTMVRTGEMNEVEPHGGQVIIGRGAIVDAIQWPHELPSEQK